MAKIRYDIEKRQSARGRWRWFWIGRTGGRYATIREAIRAARRRNQEEQQ